MVIHGDGGKRDLVGLSGAAARTGKFIVNKRIRW